MNPAKPPPTLLQIEQAVLGSILCGDSHGLLVRIDCDWFADPAHRAIFGAIAAGEPPESAPALDELGGVAYLYQLTQCGLPTAVVEAAVVTLSSAWGERRALDMAETATRFANTFSAVRDAALSTMRPVAE
jgi:replicative DNA helicase